MDDESSPVAKEGEAAEDERYGTENVEEDRRCCHGSRSPLWLMTGRDKEEEDEEEKSEVKMVAKSKGREAIRGVKQAPP